MSHVAKIHDDLEVGVRWPTHVNFLSTHGGDLLTGLDLFAD